MSDTTDTPITDQFEYYFSNHDSCAGESIYTVAGDRDVTWDDSYSGYSVPSRVARDIERQFAEVRAQRDRLAEVLRMIATHNEGDGQCDNGHTPRWMALDALATLERKEEG